MEESITRRLRIEKMFCKNALVQTRGEGLNDQKKLLWAVKSDPKYSDNLLIDSYASQWKLRGTWTGKSDSQCI